MAIALANKRNPSNTTMPDGRLRPLFLRKRRTFFAKKPPAEKVYGRGCCKGAAISVCLTGLRGAAETFGQMVQDFNSTIRNIHDNMIYEYLNDGFVSSSYWF